MLGCTPRRIYLSTMRGNEMNWILRKIVKLFFNTLYRVKPPDSVKYYKTQESARARLMNAKDGSIEMEIKGEKYPFRGFPRGHVLTGSLAKLKKRLKDVVFNQVFEQIEKMYEDTKYHALPTERCAPAVREMDRIFEKLVHMEVTDDMRGRINLIRKVIIFFLQEDDAYRYRAQAFLSMIDQKKIKLTKEDLYFARAKYWKPDLYKKIGGKWMDAYEY